MPLHPRTIRAGLAVGGIAYFTAIALYSVLDLLAARDALFTADMLGRAVFMGLRDPAVHMFPYRMELAPVLWSGGLQFPLSLAAGLALSAGVEWAERQGVRRRGVAVALLSAAALALVAADAVAMEVRPVLPWASILAANGLSLVIAMTFLVTRVRTAPPG